MTRSTDTTSLIESLAADAAPVRRLRPPALRLALWLGALVVSAAWVFSGGVRPNLQQHLASPAYLAELAVLVTAILLLGRASFAAGVPGNTRWGMAVIGAALLVTATAFTLSYPANTTLDLGLFIGMGFPCAVRTTVLSLLPTSWLLLASARGWPLSPGRAGMVAGMAGFAVGFTMMRVLCTLDDPPHVGVWHWTPVLLGSAVSAAAGAVAAFARR